MFYTRATLKRCSKIIMKNKIIFAILAILITVSVIGSSAYYIWQSERYYNDISFNSDVNVKAFQIYDVVVTDFRDFQNLSTNSENLTQEARIAKLEETIQKLTIVNEELNGLRGEVLDGATDTSREYAIKVREVITARQELVETYVDVLSFEVCVAKVQNTVDLSYNQSIVTINSLGNEKGTVQNIQISNDAIALINTAAESMKEFKPCFEERRYISWASELDIVLNNDAALMNQMVEYITLLIAGIQEQNPEKVTEGIAGLEERDIKYPSFYLSNEYNALYDTMWNQVQEQNTSFVQLERELTDLFNKRPGLFFWF